MAAKQEKSIAFEAGRQAYQCGVPLEQSALRKLRIGSAQYEDYVDGYDSAKSATSKRKQ
ncbi:hypothetical protein ACVHUK_002973 [Pseudomonas aeruginosa]|nr:hypothetical protein M770_30425 [Pseudomonas aeruginosa VRFPA03]